MKKTVAIVTGASSGIGRCTAVALRDKGCVVYDFSRREILLEGIKHITTDVTDENNIVSSLDFVFENEGKINILVNCAGYGISGAIEFTETSDVKNQFEVNFFGTDKMCRAIIPYMRKSGGGRIVNISSVASVTHIPFQAYYSATKSAIDSYTCELSNELKSFGISATAVQPGDICTEFTQSRKKSYKGDNIYNGKISRSVSNMEKDEQKGMKPDVAGGFIAKIAMKKNVKPLYSIGLTYKTVCLLCKIFPCGFRNKIIGMLYAR